MASATVTALPVWATMRCETSDVEKLPVLVPLRVTLRAAIASTRPPTRSRSTRLVLIVEREQPAGPVEHPGDHPAHR